MNLGHDLFYDFSAVIEKRSSFEIHVN